MHGACHDYAVLKTVKDGFAMPSGEEMYGGRVGDYVEYGCDLPREQATYRRILEIGALDICGSQQTYDYIGRGPRWLDQVGCEEYVGLDLIAGPCVTLVANAHAMPLEDESFDLVVCMNMLEHDSDPPATLAETHRVLRSGQPLLLTTVNETWAPHPQLGGGDTETFNRITVGQFTQWVVDAGFKDAEIIEWRGNLFCWALR
jgi:SAM-dependent methyltransferase